MTAEEYSSSLAGFLQEAQLLERFVHHGVVRVLDYFEEGNSAYLVEEFLDGFSLLSGIEKAGRMSWRRVQLMLHQIGFGLKLVHSAGLVHSDIKPDNIFLCRDGRYVLIDFGLSRGFLSRQASERGARGVSPGYSPPEQYRRGQRLGPEADVYALAATAYHLLTGIEPPDSLERLQGATLPSIADLSTPLSDKIQDALLMAVDPDQTCRTKSIDDFLRQLGLDVSAKSSPYKPEPFGLVVRKSAHRTGVTCLAFCSATNLLISGGKDGFIRTWDWPSLTLRGQVHGHDQPVSALSIAQDGSFLLSGNEAGQIRFWDTNIDENSQGHLLTEGGPSVQRLLANVRDGVFSATFSDGTCSLFGPGLKISRLFSVHRGVVSGLSVHPTGEYLATGGDDGKVSIWSVRDQSLVMNLEGHIKSILSVHFHGDGLHVLSASTDMSVRLWSLASGECLRIFKGHQAAVWEAQFIGTDWLATLASDHQLRLFRHDHSRIVLESEAHKNWGKSLVIDEVSGRLATAGGDGEIAVWDISSQLTKE